MRNRFRTSPKTTQSRGNPEKDSGQGSAATTAFSLVEVMLALAVIAIGLIAIVGMIPHGVQASRDAADNTLVATIAHDTFNQIRQYGLNNSWPLTLPSATLDTYYDALGTNQFTSASADTYYHVHLTTPVSTKYLLTVTATVTWPVKSATATPLNTTVFVTQIANYQQP